MVELNFGRAFRDFERYVARDVQRQVPFAAARALTRTAQGGARVMGQRLTMAIDRPTPFTLRAPMIIPARKSRLVSVIKARDRQADYLEILETGGRERPRGAAEIIAVNARRNRYGNLPRRAIARLLARKDVFQGTVNGVPGIWKRKRGGSLELMVAFESEIVQPAILKVEPAIVRYVLVTMEPEFERSLLDAIATAR